LARPVFRSRDNRVDPCVKKYQILNKRNKKMEKMFFEGGNFKEVKKIRVGDEDATEI